MMQNIVERIRLFNQDRDPKLIQLKYHEMRADVFAFFRGTCHLFYEDWPAHSSLNDAPSAWICGDLHLQNVGSYKADNRLVYFNINDFDESALAPCTWDLARFVTCLFVSARSLKINGAKAVTLGQCFLDVYAGTLARGRVRTVEDDKALGLVRDMLFQVKTRSRKDLLDARTVQSGETRTLRIDEKHIMPVTESERAAVVAVLENWGAKQPDPAFFKVLDVAHRIAGISSLGIDRYIILVEGKGSPDRNYLLDLKEETASSLQPYLTLPQPQWDSQAERAVLIQRWVQMMPRALLAAIGIGERCYILRELQPTADKVNVAPLCGRLSRLEQLVTEIAKVVAWDQLHSGGHRGAASAIDLMAFAGGRRWRDAVLSYARSYAARVDEDYRRFCSAYDSGAFSAEGVHS